MMISQYHLASRVFHIDVIPRSLHRECHVHDNNDDTSWKLTSWFSIKYFLFSCQSTNIAVTKNVVNYITLYKDLKSTV